MTKWIPILVFLASGAFLFQNCGELQAPLESQGLSSAAPVGESPETEGELELPVDDPNTVLFVAGDELTLEKIPFPMPENAQMRLMEYLESTSPRALLFTQDGNPIFIIMPAAADQAEANLKAPERCELDTKKLCSLFAAGNTILFNEEDFYGQFRSVLRQPDIQLNFAQIPGIVSGQVDMTAGRFGPYPDVNNTFTSLALGSWGAIHRGWSSDSQANADRRAQEFCESANHRPCLLYAQGMQVVFNLENYDFGALRIQYGPAPLDLNRIPFISDTQRRTVLNTAVRDALAGRRVVIALSRYGNIRVEEQQAPGAITDATRQRVRDACTASINRAPGATGYQHQCFIYSELNQVVMTREDFEFYALGRPRPTAP